MSNLWPSPRAGQPHPLGASLSTDPADGSQGVNFAVFSRHATAVQVQLMSDTGATSGPPIPLQPLGHGRWAVWVPGLGDGQRYTLHAHGPWQPAQGHCFRGEQSLIDPWACGLLGDTEQLAQGGAVPHSLVVDQASERAAGEAMAPRPRVGADRVVLYEAHVKALTRLHPDVPEPLRGTYAGLASPAMLAHLARLGITTVCLLPVHQRLTERHLLDKGLSNHWGYNPLQVFVPDPRFAACTAGQAPQTPGQAAAVRAEFRAMVDTLHRHGVEVVLDVVFNHTAESDMQGPTLSWRGLDNASWYALDAQGQPHNFSGCGNSLNLGDPAVVQWAMDCLRWWVQAYGVDGFRFDLATSLGRQAEHGHRFSPHAPLLTAMAQDPVLAPIRLIAEPWDLGPDGYRLGQFPPRWLEWNDRYRDTVRAFWLGHPCTPGDMARVLLATSDRFHHSGRQPLDSINLITAHDGFTLNDLTAYTERHNQANGENNRDGHAHNLSANGGEEGPSHRLEVQDRRLRWRRALLATLWLSQGTPQLLAGDELGHSQKGNNNAYCQDNLTTWLHWARTDPGLLHSVSSLSALRRAHPGLRRAQWFSGQPLASPPQPGDCPLHADGSPDPCADPTPCQTVCPVHCPWAAACHGPDVAWRDLDGGPMTPLRWNDPHARSLTCVITVGEAGQLPTERLLLALHAADTPQTLVLPPGDWTLLLDTAKGLPAMGIADAPPPPLLTVADRLALSACSVVLLAQPLQDTTCRPSPPVPPFTPEPPCSH